GGRPSRRRHARAGPPRRGARLVQDRDREGRAAQSREADRRSEAERAGRLQMRTLRLVPAALALALAGCGVFGIGSSSDAPKPTALSPITSSVNLKAVWSASVGKSGGYQFVTEIEGGRVYAAAADGTITMLEEDNGRLFGRIDAKRKLSGGLAVEDGKIIVGTLKGDVLAID